MINQTRLFENSECRLLFAALSAAAAFSILITVLFGFAAVTQLKSSLVQRESAVAGRLIHTGAAKTDDIIDAFIARDNADTVSNAKTGLAALQKAGYGDDTVDLLAPFLNGDVSRFSAMIIIAVIAFFVLFGALTFLFLKRIYRRVDEAGRQALFVSRGDYSVRLKENGEGTFARMNHAFNEMSNGVNAGFEKLSRERVFLKNLLSDISHQLKTPLAALKMYNEILLQEQISDAARDFTIKSGEQLERMEWLILGLLKMTRVEADCLDMHLQRNDVLTIVEEAANDFELAAKEKNIEIIVKSEENPLILCDAEWLKEAMGNVIKNCIEYTPAGGRITAEVEKTPVMVSVKISDTGAGINPDDLPYVFRRFYRGRCSKGAGSGIGLSLAKAIVEQMGGTLAAGGEYGQGAVFTFSFLKDVI